MVCLENKKKKGGKVEEKHLSVNTGTGGVLINALVDEEWKLIRMTIHIANMCLFFYCLIDIFQWLGCFC